MMDVMAGSDKIPLFNTMWRIRTEATGLSVEAVLQDHVGAGIIFWWLQHIVLDAGDMGDKAKRFDGSVAIACAPTAVSCLSTAAAPVVPSAAIGYTAT